MFFDFGFIARSLYFFVDGLLVTISLSALTIAIVVVWGLVVALARMSDSRILRIVATVYVEVVRNTPLLVQLYIVFFGFAIAGLTLSGFASGLLALVVQNGGYVAEIYRSGIQSISVKQVEAAKGLGMSRLQVFTIVVFPQAVIRVVPPIGSQLVLIIKDTSLVSAIAVGDLMYAGKLLSETTAATYEIFFTVGAFYLIMTSSVTFLVRQFERHWAFAH